MMNCVVIIVVLVQLFVLLVSASSSSAMYGGSPSSTASSSMLTRSRRGRAFGQQQPIVKSHGLEFLGVSSSSQQQQRRREALDDSAVQECNVVLSSATAAAGKSSSLMSTLFKGAVLRVASDLSGGTPLENIKTRVTLTELNPFEAIQSIIYDDEKKTKRNLSGLYRGTPSRTTEGALIGAVFMLGSVLTKNQLLRLNVSSTVAALAGGLVGGLCQAVVMTPAGLIFTSINSNPTDTSLSVIRRVVQENGVMGMWTGGRSMCLRQATNWASRAGFTELARSALHLNEYGLMGEIASGIIGGVGSSWNTPIETIRVHTQRDVAAGKAPDSMNVYWNTIVDKYGYQGLFRGWTPRTIQGIWQTLFCIVVPNMMGL